jgi:hypothetical protein
MVVWAHTNRYYIYRCGALSLARRYSMGYLRSMPHTYVVWDRIVDVLFSKHTDQMTVLPLITITQERVRHWPLFGRW